MTRSGSVSEIFSLELRLRDETNKRVAAENYARSLHAALPRNLPEENEEAWGAGMDAIRNMLDALRTADFKDIGNAYPAVIWAAMWDAASKPKEPA